MTGLYIPDLKDEALQTLVVNDRYDVRILHDMDKERDNNISQCINYDFCKQSELTVSQYDTYQLLKNDYVLFKTFKDRENN